jgi:hypothetical protein
MPGFGYIDLEGKGRWIPACFTTIAGGVGFGMRGWIWTGFVFRLLS